jgi:hypothetical protein
MDKENSKQGRHKAKKEEWNWTNVKIQWEDSYIYIFQQSWKNFAELN